MKIYFAGGNGGAVEKIENRYILSGIRKRLYSYHFKKTCELIIKLIKNENKQIRITRGTDHSQTRII